MEQLTIQSLGFLIGFQEDINIIIVVVVVIIIMIMIMIMIMIIIIIIIIIVRECTISVIIFIICIQLSSSFLQCHQLHWLPQVEFKADADL
jgi:hypothetical protein